jgi:hypothetical protein
MTCGEFKEQVAAFALGVLDESERLACEQHLAVAATHEGCIAALRQANEAAALLALALPPVTPSQAVWSAIDAATRVTLPLGGRRTVAVVPWLLVAAAVLAMAWALRERVVVRDQLRASVARSTDESKARAQCLAELEALRRDVELRREALALLQQPGTQLVALAQKGGATASANVILHAGAKRAFVLGRGLLAPAGRDYELWVIRGARKIPAGLLRGDASGALVAAIDPTLLGEGAPDAIAVTLEAVGGRPQPQGPIVLVGKI